ncbi:hypothetical protein PUN28_009858 [Cardiocondyla obscurior]|uniref:Uncharacterized protein n=1 Tax=Cardiocondyla obscurior TaxID=286306 RepID=A0AAW2FKK0_9HYME
MPFRNIESRTWPYSAVVIITVVVQCIFICKLQRSLISRQNILFAHKTLNTRDSYNNSINIFHCTVCDNIFSKCEFTDQRTQCTYLLSSKFDGKNLDKTDTCIISVFLQWFFNGILQRFASPQLRLNVTATLTFKHNMLIITEMFHSKYAKFFQHIILDLDVPTLF